VEVKLAGGRTTSGVVQVGDTVRRPISPNADFVHRLLRHLELRGFPGAPRYLGRDAQGGEILSFVPGEVPQELGEFSDAQRAAAATLLRSLHDATTDCELRGSHEVICHGDASPCNCVFVNGTPQGFIDFDTAHAGTREDDVGYAAWLWLDIGNHDLDPQAQGCRLYDFVSAYGPAAKLNLPQLVLSAQRQLSMRSDGPAGNREWAQACWNWTQENWSRINAAFELRSSDGQSKR
jgi:Ser/Thr protein kinase RdoA (MazF antagonist)